jgi:hypothetical protein
MRVARGGRRGGRERVKESGAERDGKEESERQIKG